MKPLSQTPGEHERDVLSLVDANAENAPGEGVAFKGASLPFGMLQWGVNLAQGCNAYTVSTLAGAEMGGQWYDYLPIRPTTRSLAELSMLFAPMPEEPIARERQERRWRVSRNNTGYPGYFRSRLDEGILVELTASVRSGIARFTYTSGPEAHVILTASALTFDTAQRSVVGFHDKGAGFKVYFAVEFDTPILSAGAWNEDGICDHGDLRAEGAAIQGGYVRFECSGETVVQMRLGISYVSIENARQNLEAEIPGWDFDSVRRSAEILWSRELSRIEVSGASASQRSLFYTCLYRCLQHPNVFSDVNGDYLGFDGVVHRAQGYTHYANFSIWDIYRTWGPLIAWLKPREASDMMQSLTIDAQQGGGTMPRWPVANIETGTMEEGSATPLVAAAYAFGAREFDLEAAWNALDRAESLPGARCQNVEAHPHLALYLKLGYVPQGDDYNRKRSASFTLEYAMADFALARFSLALGNRAAHDSYLRLSDSWQTLYRDENGYLQPRNEDGSWYPDDFDPAHGHFIGFTEGNAAQYLWSVRHNLRGLIDRMGGNDRATARLDALCTELNAGPNRPTLWIGNEPSLHIPWVYNWAGQPWRAQEVVREIVTRVWRPGGTPGADDLGTLSAWYIFACLGLYPMIPGVGGFTLSSPLFERIVVHRPDGATLTISAPGTSQGQPFIQSVSLNGTPVTRPWLSLDALNGREVVLEFEMGEHPNRGWASELDSAPPSFAAGSEPEASA